MYFFIRSILLILNLAAIIKEDLDIKKAIIGPYAPSGKIHSVWICLYSMATLWETMMVPLLIAFDTFHFRTYTSNEDQFLRKINTLGNGVIIFFLIDIIFKFNLGYVE